MKLYYNPVTDMLGIADDGFELIATLKFVPVLSRLGYRTYDSTEEEIPPVLVEIALPFTDDWEEVGEF